MTEENRKLSLKANSFLGVTGGAYYRTEDCYKRRFRMDPPGHKTYAILYYALFSVQFEYVNDRITDNNIIANL